MGRFNVSSMRYLEPQHFRILLAIEMGMKNHELVPLPLVASIAAIHRGATARTLSDLAKLNLVAFERGKRYDGYRLTILGYDFLALRALTSRDVIGSVGNQIGVGKESDIYIAGDPELNDVVLKLHRLGRTSFRKLKEKRDYHQRRHFCSWLYLSRIAALKEFSFLKALYSHNFPVPKPLDVCRHTVAMALIDGVTLCHAQKLRDKSELFNKLMKIIVRLAKYGLIHGDFNEFNIMITGDNEDPVVLDFPQMVSIDHPNAEFYFNRDVDCIRTFFRRKFDYDSIEWPKFSDVCRKYNLDVEVEASGFTRKMAQDLNKAYDAGNFKAHLNDDDGVSDESSCSTVEEETGYVVEDAEQTNDEVGEKETVIEKTLSTRKARFNDWLKDAQGHLQELSMEEVGCPLLAELDETRAQKYKVDSLEAYESAKQRVMEIENDEAQKCDNDLGNKNEPERRRTCGGRTSSHKARSTFSNGSSIAPDEIKKRLLKERSKLKKEKLKAKGKQDAITRTRRDNMDVIKEYRGWDF